MRRLAWSRPRLMTLVGVLLVGLLLGLQGRAGAVECPPALVSLPAAAQDRGFLWRLSRDGHSSYLFGTLHVGKPGWRQLGPRTSAAFAASDVLALELDPQDPELPSALLETGAPPPLPADLLRRLGQACERACVAATSLAGLHPVLQVTTLTVLEARWLGMDPAYAMEQTLSAQARAAGRRVVALETIAQQKGALVPADDALALHLVDQTLQQLEGGSLRRVMGRLASAWEQGDLSALGDYENWCECAAEEEDRALLRQLNDERNPALADGIEAQHRAGKRVFAAVGALHMTGPQALPVLLALRGFKVERVAFKATHPSARPRAHNGPAASVRGP